MKDAVGDAVADVETVEIGDGRGIIEVVGSEYFEVGVGEGSELVSTFDPHLKRI